MSLSKHYALFDRVRCCFVITFDLYNGMNVRINFHTLGQDQMKDRAAMGRMSPEESEAFQQVAVCRFAFLIIPELTI